MKFKVEDIEKIERTVYIALTNKNGYVDGGRYNPTTNEISCMGCRGIKWRFVEKNKKNLVTKLNEKINKYESAIMYSEI